MNLRIATLLAAAALCGCGKSPQTSSSSTPAPSPALATALPKGPPPPPTAGIPSDHLFDIEGFGARDLNHGEGAWKLTVSRQWNGTSASASHFGPGWSDANAMRVSLIDRDALLIWRGGAGWRKAHRIADKTFEGSEGEKIQQGDKGWSAEMPGGLMLTFDSNGWLTSEKAASGPARNYSYEKNGRLVSVGTGPENLLKYSYDSSGKRVTRIDGPEGLRLDYTYDAKGRLSSATNARKVRIDYTYSDDGVLSAAQDQFGNRLDLSQPVTHTNPPVESARLDGLGPRRVAGNESNAANIKQDAFGRITNTTEPDGRTIRFEYNNLDLPTLVAVSGEPAQRMQYNEHGMLIRHERGASDWEEFSYDTGGRLASKRTAPGREQHYSYGDEDRISRVKYTGGGEVTYDYAPDGKLVDESWSSGEKRHWGYNADGHLIEFVENGLRTTYGYDTSGRLSYSENPIHGRKMIRYGAEDETTTETPDVGKSVVKTTAWGKPLAETKPGELRTTTFRYDAAGRMVGAVPPSGVPWVYDYDSADRLRSIKSPSGLTTTVERDPAGRAQKILRGEIAWREYRYDNNGRLQEEFSAAGSTAAYKYDEAGTVAEVRLPGGKVSYNFDQKALARTIEGADYLISESLHGDGSLARRVYQPAKMELRLPRDAHGRPAGIELNELKAAYGYNSRGQVEQINLPGGAIKIARDDAGRATGLAFANTAAVEIKYDRADRITRIEAKQPSGKALFTERYVCDAAGNLGESATDSGAPRKLEYDRDDRLTKYVDAKITKIFSYDVDGNLSGTTIDNKVSRAGLDQLGRPTQDGTTSYSWSATGNLEKVEGSKTKIENKFNAADQLIGQSDGTRKWSFGYLPNGDRLWKESAAGKTWYAYLPDRLAGFKDESGVTWLLVCLPGTDWPIALTGSNGQTLFIVADRMGSARRFVDGSGAIVATADFSPFGFVTASSGTAPLGLFAGMVRDESGLFYARRRYYDAQIARFISIDPEIGTVGNPATHNAYAYAGNNPLRYRDPMGTDFASEVAAPDSNIFHALTDSQQAAVKEAWDGAERARRVINSPMKSTPAEMAAATRHLQECNAALAKMNEIGRARYKYVLLATGPTEELSAAGKANAARNTAEAKAAMEAMGEMPRVGRVNLGINAENLGATIQNVRPAIPANRAPVPQGSSAMTEAGTATRGAGAGSGGGGGGGASTAWDEQLFTGKSPLMKNGPGDIQMVYDPKFGGYRPVSNSGRAASFAAEAAESAGVRSLGPKVLNVGGKVLKAAGPLLEGMAVVDTVVLAGTMAKNFTDNLNQPFKENRAMDQAARDMANDLAKRLGELAASDPSAIILGDGRKFDPNNPDDIDEIIQNLGQNIYMGRKPFDGILKFVPKLDPNVLPKTYMGAADGDTAFETTMASARQLFQTGWAARGTAREASAAMAREEAEAQAQLQSAVTTAGTRAVVESDITGVLAKSEDVKAKTAAVQTLLKALEAGETEMRAAIAKGDEAASKICDYAARAADASESEVAAWRKEATADLMAASNLLNTAQAKTDGADAGIEALQTALGELEGFKSKVDVYKAGALLADQADISPDAALAAAKTAGKNAETERAKLTTALKEIGTVAPKMTKMLAPYIATQNEAAILAAEALDLADGITEPGLFNFGMLLSAATPVIDAAIANQKAVEKAVGSINLDSTISAARDALSAAQSTRTNASAIASGPERYRPLQTASQCLALIKSAPKVTEATPTPTAAPVEDDDVIVPDLSVFGDLAEMKAAAVHAGLDPTLVATSATPIPGSKRMFITQDPLPNKVAKRKSKLKIIVAQSMAAGSPTPTATPVVVTATPSPSPKTSDDMVIVPNVVGAESIDYARTILNQAGFKSAFKAVKPESKKDELTVKTSAPAPGEKALRGSVVTVFIYQKFEDTAAASPTASPTPSGEVAVGTMPRLIGLTLDQATSRLTSNMSIGGDEVGDKPPKPDDAYTIYSQYPAVNSKIDPDKKIVVTVKRYGSAKTDEPTPSPAEEEPAPSGATGFEGKWSGTLSFGKEKPQFVTVEIRREGNTYMVHQPKGQPIPMTLQGGRLFYEMKLDFSGMLGAESKDTDPSTIRATATLVGDDQLAIYLKIISKKEPKEGPLGTMRRVR